jgi:hypothetical protein
MTGVAGSGWTGTTEQGLLRRFILPQSAILLGICLALIAQGLDPSPAGAAVAGRVKAWGKNVSGELGNDDPPNNSDVAIAVHDLSNVKQISAGCEFALAVRENGTVKAWGDNSSGELGNDDVPNDSYVPITVPGLDNVKAVSGGSNHALALKRNGTVRAWGDNGFGELGNGDAPNDSPVPVKVDGLTDVKAIAAGQDVSYALKENGTVRAWGSNSDGQLGNDDMPNNSDVPVKVKGLDNIKAIATHCEGYHALAVKRSGKVWTWGYNSAGELGDGTIDTSDVPVRVVQLSNVTAVSGGYEHSMALKENGTVWAWGDNTNGQLGDGTDVLKPVPVRVEQLNGVKEIAGGEYHSLALKRDGTMRAWGDNESGELGDETMDERHLPVRVHNLTNVEHIAAGQDTGYAVKE